MPAFLLRFVTFYLCLGSVQSALAADKNHANAYGLDHRPWAKPYLLMPERAEGVLPTRLSQTGVFVNLYDLVANEACIPYELRLSFWSDGATKSRLISVPDGERITFAATGEWKFPKGTVFVKTFDLGTDETDPTIKRRLETRLLVCDSSGGVYGATYKWRPDNSDADLLTDSLSEDFVVKTSLGSRRQRWYYPSRQDCVSCHTESAGGVLGVKTRQLNRDHIFASGIVDNELRAWNHVGLFEPKINEKELKNLPKLATPEDGTRTLEDRARSYLDVNCAQCHRPHQTVAYFDARYDTPLPQQNLIEGQVLIDQGIDRAHVIAPKDIWRSILFMRVNSTDGIKMPPLAHERIDDTSLALLRQWIQSMPGREVLAPPAVIPRGGIYQKAVELTLKSEQPEATIHYTLDGSVPTSSDPVYEKPIELTSTVIVRAKSFKPGWTKSITVQEVFNIGE